MHEEATLPQEIPISVLDGVIAESKVKEIVKTVKLDEFCDIGFVKFAIFSKPYSETTHTKKKTQKLSPCFSDNLTQQFMFNLNRQVKSKYKDVGS